MPNAIHGSLTGNFLTRHITRTIAEVLPSRIKRMLYIGSALAIITKTKQPSPELLEKLNEPLRIATNSLAIQVPAYFADKIWEGLDIKVKDTCKLDLSKGIRACEVGEMDRWRLGAMFAYSCPAWLQYGSDQLMASDIHDMMGVLARVQPS